MSRDVRIRVPWSPRGARRWCPGATRPGAVAGREQTGWTTFFRLQGVVGFLRENRGARRASGERPQGASVQEPERVERAGIERAEAPAELARRDPDEPA